MFRRVVAKAGNSGRRGYFSPEGHNRATGIRVGGHIEPVGPVSVPRCRFHAPLRVGGSAIRCAAKSISSSNQILV